MAQIALTAQSFPQVAATSKVLPFGAIVQLWNGRRSDLYKAPTRCAKCGAFSCVANSDSAAAATGA
jgi:hypothetical protein